MKEFIINENEAGQRFDKYLGKLLREAPKSFFYKMLRKKNITLNGKKADGTENTGAVGTGNKIAVYANGTLVKQYDVVIYGDINGDGKISVVDLVMMQKQILGTSQLSGAYAAAADISRDGKVSVKDLVLLQKHIINAAQIEQ